jgi:sigma-B regulation protein RsbU (phosphoserine phosphatase)
MSQCGHPFPALQRKNGSVEAFGDGGFPVGLIPNAEFEDFEIQIAAGERIILLSDGVTECPDGDGGMLGVNGFMTLVENISHLTGSAFFDTMLWDLTNFNDDKDFPDDVSAILLEYSGQGAH